MNSKMLYYCTHCDAQYPKWQGQCAECDKWGTIKEFAVENGVATLPIALNLGEGILRLPVGLNEVDSVLGGGIVPGSLLLLAGDPGIGKSTLVLQIAAHVLAKSAGEVLYVCGEESPSQIGLRLSRLSLPPASFRFLATTNLGAIIGAVQTQRPQLVIVDSIQTISSEKNDSEAGSVTQIRLSTAELLQAAKQSQVPIIIIGHVTKDGAVAGPRSLEHLVDVVLYLEGDDIHAYRLLRSVKNRFGPTNQVGVFSMTDAGLVEVRNPSELFLSQRPEALPGSVVSVIMDGSRPFLVEIQALTNKTSFGYPKRAVSGFDLSRLELLLAVLQRRAGLKLENQDVFVNIVGGLRTKDPALDLAAALAVASSLANIPLPEKTVALGEIGLGGEVRPVAHLESRLREAERLGFNNFLVPEKIKDIQSALRVLGIEK